MKKVIAILSVVALASCGGQDSTKPVATDSTKVVDTTKSILDTTKTVDTPKTVDTTKTTEKK